MVLVDWASPPERGPLKNVLNLNPEIRKILKIVEVSPDIAARHQKDSPFSEVHAMNTGFRHMSGTFFGRIDQDTLIGDRFVTWFYRQFHVEDYGFPWPLVAFSGRRNLSDEQSASYRDYVFNEEKSKEAQICHPDNFYSRVWPQHAPGEKRRPRMFLFYGGAVGILLVERNLYEKAQGFNEDFIYMNNMDIEFLNRLRQVSPFYNLGLKCDADFYHLNHTRSDGAEYDLFQPHADTTGARQTNPMIIRKKVLHNDNPPNWGLLDEDVQVYSLNG